MFITKCATNELCKLKSVVLQQYVLLSQATQQLSKFLCSQFSTSNFTGV